MPSERQQVLAKLAQVKRMQSGVFTRGQAARVLAPDQPTAVAEAALQARLAERDIEPYKFDDDTNDLPSSEYEVFRFAHDLEAAHTDIAGRWAQLVPNALPWQRHAGGIWDSAVSHESAADIYEIGTLNNHKTTFLARKGIEAPTAAVRVITVDEIASEDIQRVAQLPVVRMHKIVGQLLQDGRYEPALIGRVAFDAVRKHPQIRGLLVKEVEPYASQLGAESGADALRGLLSNAMAEFGLNRGGGSGRTPTRAPAPGSMGAI